MNLSLTGGTRFRLNELDCVWCYLIGRNWDIYLTVQLGQTSLTGWVNSSGHVNGSGQNSSINRFNYDYDNKN